MHQETVGWRRIWSLAEWRMRVVWITAAALGGAAALYLIYAERWSIDFTRQVMARSPYLAALLVGVGMVVVFRLRDLVFPGTEGTGIPQAMAALQMEDGPQRTRLLSMRIAIGKLILLTLALFAGATVGREGPSVHVAACCLYASRRFATFPPYLLDRGLILAGGAAGIAAAFNAPIAGLVFAIEEIGRSFDKRRAGFIVRAVIVACLVCISVLSNYLFYGQVEAQLRGARHWVYVAAIGIACGLLGGCFAQAVASITPRIARLGRRRPFAVAGSLGLALAVLGLLTGGITYGAGDEQARAILQGVPVADHYPLTKALASFVSLISSIPGGLFTPSLSVGAGLGQLAIPWLPDMDRRAVVLLAMAAYFSGVVQSPLTAAVIVLEMTGAHLMILPLLFATSMAYRASRLVCPVPLYEALASHFLATKTQSHKGGLP